MRHSKLLYLRNLFPYQIILQMMLIYSLLAQNTDPGNHATFPLNCMNCHSCAKPTYEEPCLKIFPEFSRKGVSVHHTSEDAPEIITITKLTNLYEPSEFSHRKHAEMAEMGSGCTQCHHFNPPGDIVPCSKCHLPQSSESDINRLGLKGAYHRQCMNCHREWSNKLECESCHQYQGPVGNRMDLTHKIEKDIQKLTSIQLPGKKIILTEMDEDSLVTFYHDEHITLFGLTCQDCHRNESCSKCHNREKQFVSEREPHQNCITCHEAAIEDACQKCHDKMEKPPFNHSRTGFALVKYHSEISCTECHKKNSFTRLGRQCSRCHSSWSPESFQHIVTGFVLDENHAEQDCETCHIDGNFTNKPRCDDCHDEIAFPKNQPGRFLLSRVR